MTHDEWWNGLGEYRQIYENSHDNREVSKWSFNASKQNVLEEVSLILSKEENNKELREYIEDEFKLLGD